jgi:hypothetical protein
VISPESQSIFDVKYNELLKRIWVNVEGELELYDDCGMFPAVRVRAVLWKFIADILAKTSSKTETESLTKISEMAELLIEIRESNDKKMIAKEPQWTFRRLIVESGVVIRAAEQPVRGELN